MSLLKAILLQQIIYQLHLPITLKKRHFVEDKDAY